MPTNYSRRNRLKTASAIATELGIHKTTVTRIAAKHNIGRKIDDKIASSQRIFVQSDVSKIKKLCYFSRGNPSFLKNSKKRA